MRGEAIAHGAATIVSALATGRGAAVGVDLWTKARVELVPGSNRIVGRILSDPAEEPKLIVACVSLVLEKYHLASKFGAVVETDSNIPIARGLKSSSAASNAIVLATLKALGKKTTDVDVVRMGVEASRRAAVTKTGALDDACASYFGNVYVTDNLRNRVLRRFLVDEDLAVLFHLGDSKKYTADVDMASLRPISDVIEAVHHEAMCGRYWRAMTMNGLAFAAMMGFDAERIAEALRNGAIAAGLSGKGPAVAAVVSPPRVNDVKQAWKRFDGQVIEAKINRRRASP